VVTLGGGSVDGGGIGVSPPSLSGIARRPDRV
jgi:hypothetical protein